MVVGGNWYKNENSAFSLAEFLLAFALLTVAILALIGLSLSALQAGQKSSDVMDASEVSVRLISEISAEAASDQGFWDADYSTTPYKTGVRTVGKTEFSYEAFATILRNQMTGEELGSGASGNRIKKLDLVINWFGEQPKAGYGNRTLRDSCLINEDT